MNFNYKTSFKTLFKFSISYYSRFFLLYYLFLIILSFVILGKELFNNLYLLSASLLFTLLVSIAVFLFNALTTALTSKIMYGDTFNLYIDAYSIEERGKKTISFPWENIKSVIIKGEYSVIYGKGEKIAIILAEDDIGLSNYEAAIQLIKQYVDYSKIKIK